MVGWMQAHAKDVETKISNTLRAFLVKLKNGTIGNSSEIHPETFVLCAIASLRLCVIVFQFNAKAQGRKDAMAQRIKILLVGDMPLILKWCQLPSNLKRILFFCIFSERLKMSFIMLFADSDGFCGFQKMSEETYSFFASLRLRVLAFL